MRFDALHRRLLTLPHLFDLRSIAEQLHRILMRPLDPNEVKLRLYSLLLYHYGHPLVAKALAVKVLNLLVGRYHYRARHTALTSQPFGLIVDPANGCHLRCPGCVHSPTAGLASNWPSGMLSIDKYSDFLFRQGPFAIHTMFYNFGELLFNPQTPAMIRLAKRYLIQTMLSTSMSIANFSPERWIDCGLDYMILSIDGATQAIYEKFRRGGNLSLVLDNLRRLVAAKLARGSQTPILCWQFLAFEHNAHEIISARRLAAEIGVDEFNLVSPYDVSWDDPAIRGAPIAAAKTIFHAHAETYLIDNWNCAVDDMAAAPIEAAFT